MSTTSTDVSTQDVVERALQLSTRRRLHRPRAGVQRGQPALGREHPDHQRRDARPQPHGHRDGRRRRGHGHRCRVPQQRRLSTRSRRWSAAAEAGRPRRPARRGRRARWSRPRVPAGHGLGRAAGRDVDRRLRRARRRRWARSFARRPGRPAGELFGFAEHQLHTTYLGTSTGVRLRHVQPTGRIEVNGKTADWSRSSWVGQSTRDFTDVDMTAVDAELARRLALGGAPGRPRRRPVRDAAAAERGRRPDGLPVLDRRRPATPTRAAPCSAGRAAAPGSASGSPTSRCGLERPGGAGPRVRPVRVRHLVGLVRSRCSTTGCRWARPTGSPTASSRR